MKKSPVIVIISIALGVSLLANVFLGIKVINSDGTEVKTDVTEIKQEANANNKVSETPAEEENEFTPYELSGAPQTLMNTDNSKHEDYDFEIKSARLDKDYSDKDIVVVTYSFTNNSNSAENFDMELDDKAFQNGVELEPIWSLSENRDLKGDDGADVMPGYASEFEMAYRLNDSSTDIVVQIGEHSTVLATRTFTME